jgi:hypothetical protein
MDRNPAGKTPRFAARAVPAADRLFHREPRWLGGDGALTVPLANDRILWLFGDSFVAKGDVHRRNQSVMVRNSVAIQRGRDPLTATLSFAWRTGSRGEPASFFPERGDRWYWPGHGARLAEGPLVLFLFELIGTPGEGLGFASTGYGVVVIDNPESAPLEWQLQFTRGPALPFDALPATAVVRDGEHIVGVAIRQRSDHAGALVRWKVAAIARGDLESAEWWAGVERGWVPTEALGAAGPVFVLDDAGAECSLHRDPQTGTYLHVATYGFGATDIGVRTAPALTGPWSEPRIVFRPPESDGPRPFVYAAKAHPELVGLQPGDLLVTYATNSFTFADLFSDEGERSLYWPRFVAVRW